MSDIDTQKLSAEAKKKAEAIQTLLAGDEPDLEQVAELQGRADKLIAQVRAAQKSQWGRLGGSSTIQKMKKMIGM